MSYLGGRILVGRDARLTAVSVLPFLKHARWRDGVVVWHRVRFTGGQDEGAAVGALAAFLPAAVCTLTGVEADGGSWGVVFQCAPQERAARHGPQMRTFAAADAAVGRALDLTGVAGNVRSRSASTSWLADPYNRVGVDVGAWSIAELVVGLLVELATNDDLDRIADLAGTNRPGVPTDERIVRMLHRLRDWSTTYEGPER